METIKCPNCGKTAKRIKAKKYPEELWHYCTNPSCNRTGFKMVTNPIK